MRHHLKPPPKLAISLYEFKTWKYDNPVTKQLFNDIETLYVDLTEDPLSTTSIDKIAIESIKREAWREMIDAILQWSPFRSASDSEDNDNA